MTLWQKQPAISQDALGALPKEMILPFLLSRGKATYGVLSLGSVLKRDMQLLETEQVQRKATKLMKGLKHQVYRKG